MSNNHQRVKEDGPEYRSVMMGPSANHSMLRSLSPSVKKLGHPQTTSPSSCSGRQSLTESDTPSRRWELKELPKLPADHMLVRPNVYVGDASPQLVADRICNTLRMLAISADYKALEGENALLAETQNGAKFAVRLFGQNNMAVVEIQRQAGCSFEFRDAAKAILRSAKGLQHRAAPGRRFTIPSTLPKRSHEVHQKCIQDDFRIAYRMLSSGKSDAQALALESMEKMTKSCVTKDAAAKKVLGDCLKQLLSVLDTYSADQSISQEESCQSYNLRQKVFAVLANSCEAIGKPELAAILSTDDNDLKTRSFLCILLSSLREAPLKPHDAFQAVRCLRYLLISKEVEIAMIEMSAIEVISSARAAGSNCHGALESESRKLMTQLQNVC